MIMAPQVEGVQDAAVAAAAGVEAADVDDIDMPPQALRVAASKTHARAGSHRCGLTHP
jgi:hypothetical protein